MMKAETEALSQDLAARRKQIGEVVGLLHETKRLYGEYAAGALGFSYDRFGPLEESILSDELTVVVLGEFSRGKSSLLNALLGMKALPAAQQATTAASTFIRALKEGDEPYALVRFPNGTVRRIPFSPESGSELRLHGSALAEYEGERPERIDICLRHPLLDEGLVIVDTPGFGSMSSGHDDIARKAADTAHAALWVQSAEQLGGNRDEWAAMREILSANFSRFITVINMWDLVLDPQDAAERSIPAEERSRRKLELAASRFRAELGGGHFELLPVSALWGASAQEEQRALSGLAELSARIGGLCRTSSAERLAKPLAVLGNLQQTLRRHLCGLRDTLSDPASEDRNQAELDALEREIADLEARRREACAEAEEEHARLAEHRVGAVLREVAEPIRSLKGLVDAAVTPERIRSQMEQGATSIVLPDGLDWVYPEAVKEVVRRFEEQKKAMASDLAAMRSLFAAAMAEFASGLSEGIGGMNLSLPEVDVSLDAGEEIIGRFLGACRHYIDTAEGAGQADPVTSDGRTMSERLIEFREQAILSLREKIDREGLRMTEKAFDDRIAHAVRKFRREIEKADLAAQGMLRQDAAETLCRRLLARSSEPLGIFAGKIENDVCAAIRRMYAEQLQVMKDCVERQFMEPMQSRSAQIRARIEAASRGREELLRRSLAAADAVAELDGIIRKTDGIAAGL